MNLGEDEPERPNKGGLPSSTPFVWAGNDDRGLRFPAPTSAVKVNIGLSLKSYRRLDLRLYAEFGRHVLPDSLWIDCAEIKYELVFGVQGGELLVRIRNGSAPAATLLGQTTLPVSETQQLSATDEATTETSRSASGKFTLNLLRWIGEMATSRSSKRGSKAAVTRQLPINVPVIQSNGSGEHPSWTFRSAIPGCALRGLSPGGEDGPPLALVEMHAEPVEVAAAFVVRAEDLVVLDVRGSEFRKGTVATLAVAQKALPIRLQAHFETQGGQLLLAGDRAGFPSAASDTSGLIMGGDSDGRR